MRIATRWTHSADGTGGTRQKTVPSQDKHDAA